ncbi:MAG TPA: creatininase family protein, partial [Brevundimonas sp.]
MTEVMLDVFRSLAAAGFTEVFCVTGRFDAAHVRAAAEAVRRAREEGVLQVWLVLHAPLAGRLSLSGDAGVAVADWPTPAASFPDLHAGDSETSVMLSIAPDRVDGKRLAGLKATDLPPAAVDRWRRGGAEARMVTPDGYPGAPGDASAAKGTRFVVATSDAYAAAIMAARSPAAE